MIPRRTAASFALIPIVLSAKLFLQFAAVEHGFALIPIVLSAKSNHALDVSTRMLCLDSNCSFGKIFATDYG